MKFNFSRKKDKYKVPIIIGGFYRSGTSLLRRIIDSHSRIHCPPEIKFFKDFYGDYLDDHLHHVRFFSTVRSLGLSDSELLKIYGKAFITSHEIAAKKCNKKRWADKNPENLLNLDEWYELLDGKMFFIFMFRNPMDTIASLLEIGFPKTVPPSLQKKVDLFCTHMYKGIVFIEKHPDITFCLKYEDLVEQPRDELIKLFNFIGEKFEDVVLTDFISEKRGRGIEDPKICFERSIHTKSVNRWQKDLTREQLDFILHRCADIIEKLGYKYLMEQWNMSVEPQEKS